MGIVYNTQIFFEDNWQFLIVILLVFIPTILYHILVSSGSTVPHFISTISIKSPFQGIMAFGLAIIIGSQLNKRFSS